VRSLCAVAFLVLVQGCSGVRIAYDNADTFIRWRLQQMLDVQGDAADELDERIDAFLRWHRKNELPIYARDADDIANRVTRGLTQEDLVWGYDAFRARARESLRRAVDELAPLLDRLAPDQLQHLEQQIADENRKFARENLRGSERERRDRRTQRIVARLEDWVGSLSEAQIARVRLYSARAPLLDEMRDRDNKRLQADVVAIIRAREARQRLAERAVGFERGRDPAYTAARDENVQEFFAMLLDLDRMASREQRSRFAAELRRYAAEFRALAARSAAS
jgi:hypothetical protein